MIAYGTKIDTDIAIPLRLDGQKTFRHRLCLYDVSTEAPDDAATRKIATFEAHGRTVTIRSDRALAQNAAEQPWSYDIEGVATFYWRGGEQCIGYVLREQGTPALLGFWLIHLQLPFYLMLEGVYDFLHAGAVAVDRKTVLFMAPSMGGKSTMTDYFVRQGHSLISDDKVATYIENGTFKLAPSHAYRRPYRAPETLGNHATDAGHDFKTIDIIVILRAGGKEDVVSVRPIEGYQKFHAVYPNYLFAFPFLKKQRIQYLTGMLNGVKVFEVDVPWDKQRIDEVYRTICECIKASE